MATRFSLRLAKYLVFTLIVGLDLAQPSWSQTRPNVQILTTAKPLSALYVGNSFFYYNNGMPSMVNRLASAATPSTTISGVMATISGAGLDWHDMESYFRSDALGSYRFNAANDIEFKQRTPIFDLAIMMDCSLCPIHPKLQSKFHETAKKDSDIARLHGAEPVLFMSWPYADAPEMTAQLAREYTKAGNDNNALVIPAGLAFARTIEKHPEINLYAPDKRHPSLAGSYLGACTIYASVFNRSPEGLSFTAGLDKATASALQTTAWETAKSYYGG